MTSPSDPHDIGTPEEAAEAFAAMRYLPVRVMTSPRTLAGHVRPVEAFGHLVIICHPDDEQVVLDTVARYKEAVV